MIPVKLMTLTVSCFPLDDQDLQGKAWALTEVLRHQPPVTSESNLQLHLVYTAKGLELQTLHLEKKHSASLLTVDFVHGNTGYRRLHGGGIGQPLARAVGLKSGYRPTVVDATAGLGSDGFILASLGCQVTMIERSPIMGTLLSDGLERAANHPTTKEIASRIHLLLGSASELIIRQPERPAAIYLDPMYPHRHGSALNKQAMRIIRSLVGDDPDAATLLETALTVATNRVVVKRPKGAPTLNNRRPSHIIEQRFSHRV